MPENQESMSHIKVEQAQIRDAKGIASVQRDAWLQTYPNETIGVTIADVEDRYADMDKRTARWEEKIQGLSESRNLFVVHDGDILLGFCAVMKEEKENNLSALYVDPKHQYKGVGRALATAGLEWLGTEKDISVFVADYNTRAISFYQTLGFEDTGERLLEDSLKLKSGAQIPEMKMMLKIKK